MNNELPGLTGIKDNAIDKIYCLQINRSNLRDYLQMGIIAPSQYIDNRVKDAQSDNDQYLLLSKGATGLDKEQLLIELNFSKEEKNSLLQVENNSSVVAYSFPIPITRIKTIFVMDKDVKSSLEKDFVLGSINQVGYIPKELFRLMPQKKQKTLMEIQLSNVSIVDYSNQSIHTEEIKNNLQKFDKIMGLFAFIKNTNLYLSDKYKKISNYSDHYFHYLSFLNSEIKVDNHISSGIEYFIKKLLLIEPIDQQKELDLLIYELYTKNVLEKDFMQKLINHSNKADEESKAIIMDLFDPLTNKQKKLNSLKQDKQRILYYAGFLYSFKHKEPSEDRERLKFNLDAIETIDRVETILALFGLYFGYSGIRAEENIDTIKDAFFKKIHPKINVNMKFMMNSKLDYITIESIYQYVFFNKLNNENFSYLDLPVHTSKNHKLVLPPLCKEIKKSYLDVVHHVYEYIALEDYVKEHIEKYGDEITDKYNIFTFYKYIFKKDYRSNIKTPSFITKEDFILAFQNCDIFPSQQNHLLDCIEHDKKYNGIKG